jgi:hypothetical protein
MKGRNFMIRVRMNGSEYDTLKVKADERGQTVSDYVRDALAQESTAFDLSQLAGELRNVATARGTESGTLEPVAIETLLLLRELVMARDAQILGRVRQQVEARFPGRRAAP